MERAEGPEAGATGAGTAGADPAATALGLGGASREDAGNFLKKQGALIDLQMHHLHEQFKELRLGIWEKRLGVLLRLATVAVGFAFAAAIGLMIRDATESSGLLIAPFAVPPDLAAQGISGQVVASQMLDRLTAMQNDTISTRPAKSYANDWSKEGIKLDIPETGVSLTELDAFLRDRLGHDTHITGEIIRTPSGLSLTARAGGDGAQSVTGAQGDLDGLVEKSAEAIYRLTQPYRYGMYLASHDRLVEAIAVFKAVANGGGPRLDRAWSYPYWALLSGEEDGIDSELRLLQQAVNEEPENVQAQLVIGIADAIRSLPEQTQRDWKKTAQLLSDNRLGLYNNDTAANLERTIQSTIDMQLGNFRDAAQGAKAYIQARSAAAPVVAARLAGTQAREHDLAAARATIADMPNFRLDFQRGYSTLYTIEASMVTNSQLQNWAGVLSDADGAAILIRKYPGMRSFLPTTVVPLTAYAEARLGRIAAAQAHIAATPADCYDCLITRAWIADLQGQHNRADWWFARAVNGQQSIPFAYSDWGLALLARGEPDAAIDKFRQANQKGPKFADPLIGWGEALMAKNLSHLALAKFAEAEKYAPNWGRLHLKWGEALFYSGKRDEARAQFARAAALDLTPAEHTELMRQAHT